MKITKISLAYKTSIFVLLVIITLSGLVSYSGLPVESFPSIKQPMVIVSVPYVGVSPEDMETLIANPIEKKLKEITKINELKSTNLEGYTNITAKFESDMDIDEAVRKVREKVDQAKPDLPSDVDEPIVQEVNFENIPIMLVSIVGNQSLVRLKKVAEDLQDAFEQIPGVLEVKLSGGLEHEVRVDLNPNRLAYYNLGIEDVTKAIRNENLTMPGGSIEGGRLRFSVRIPGEFKSVEEMNKIVVKQKEGRPVYLDDLAEVYFGFKDETSHARLNKKPTVTLSILKRSGENIINISDAVKKILNEEAPRFPAGVEYVISNDQSKDIRRMVNDLENNIISGLILVVLVLYFFMGARNGFLVGISIPLSMLLSFIVIDAQGYTLNMIVLFSLILALGMLVDNAIVIIENIYRHHEEGKPLRTAAYEGTKEVGVAVITSTATTLAAFSPMVFWPGVIGEFMSYLPVTLIITLTASLVVGLVFNPVLAARFLKKDTKMDQLAGSRLLDALLPRYERTMNWALQHKGRVMGLTFIAYILMIFVFGIGNHGIEFFPDLEPKQAWVKIDMPNGTRLAATDEVAREVEKRIQDTQDMKYFVTDVGHQTNMSDFSGGKASTPHKAQVTIEFVERPERHQNSFITLKQVASEVKNIPGAQVDVVKQQDGPPTGKAVEINIKGEDFSVLDAISGDIQKKIRHIPGLVKLKDNYEVGKPELRIRIDREKAALFGLNTSKIARAIRTAINGSKTSSFRMGTDDYDITVRFAEPYRNNINDLMHINIFNKGTMYPLANFARVELASGLTRVNHNDRDRVVTVSADAFGRNSAEVLADVKQALEGYTPPPGYNIYYGGQDVEQEKAKAFLSRAFIIALFLIFFILVSEFNSVILPVTIMISVVLSFFGVFFGLLVTGKPFGIIMTGIGIISLAGVVVNNAIVLIDYIQKLRERGMNKTEAIIRAGKTRMRPVLLTAITTILGLVPLTIGLNIDFIGLLKLDFHNVIEIGAESSQWWGNMGVAVIFGLLFATALTLVIVPVMYDILTGWSEKVSRYFQTSENTTVAVNE
ncbi:MAG: efflux RND transporter permease subunit [Calditrichaeota bacterium]|nr:MAG: efflux RND transporter permease subunit [Calditrichota bacterium]